jgi:hypothetical protein
MGIAVRTSCWPGKPKSLDSAAAAAKADSCRFRSLFGPARPFVGRFLPVAIRRGMAIIFARKRLYRAFAVAISAVKAKTPFVLFRIHLPDFAL